jgi:hypothetical protein
LHTSNEFDNSESVVNIYTVPVGKCSVMCAHVFCIRWADYICCLLTAIWAVNRDTLEDGISVAQNSMDAKCDITMQGFACN